MIYYCPEKHSNITVSPNQRIGGGGEGNIYPVSQIAGCLAKILHEPTAEQRQKLEVMIANPCNGHTTGHLAVAWPEGLLFANSGRRTFAGFLMPHVAGGGAVLDFYHPKTRRLKCPNFNYRYLHRAALNLTKCICLAHDHGYVVGDVNESNALVSDNACVTIVDCDSWQVRDPATKKLFRCSVGKPDFIPPELQGKNLGRVTRTELHDRFALGVLLFKMLMEGTHPFDAIYQGNAVEAPPIEARIAAGHFPHGGRHVPWTPKPLAPPFSILHPKLQQLFIRCFAEGHFNARTRPAAREWRDALAEAEKSLVVCAHNNQHWFGKHLGHCPWCERTGRMGGIDPFPPSAVMRPVRTKRKPVRHADRSSPMQNPPVLNSTVPQPAIAAPLQQIASQVNTAATQQGIPQPVFVVIGACVFVLFILILISLLGMVVRALN